MHSKRAHAIPTFGGRGALTWPPGKAIKVFDQSRNMRTLRYSCLCLTLAGALASGFGAETIYHPATAGNSASVAAPRDDWYADVQRKFDRFGGKHADIVFDGDSIMNRWEDTGRAIWSQRYAGIAADFGIEGDRVENVLWRLDKGQLDGIDPKVVVLMIGTNNSGRNSADEIAAGIKLLVAEYEKRCPHAHIILMGIFPRGRTADDGGRRKVAAVNAQIKELGGTDRVTYLDIGPKMIEADGSISPDMMPDSVHPTLKGYQIWADAVQPVIDQYVPKEK
jgi:lysophospholipase L1-like esterase